MASASQNPRIKPRALRPGDKVGIVAPASNVSREMLEAGCDGLRRVGCCRFYCEWVLECGLYFAGWAERRAGELEEMFVRDDIRAIVCARGGYGSNYLLPALDSKTFDSKTIDIKKIAAHPKIFVGYSDLTTLLTTFADSANFVTFHGPMVAKDFARADLAANDGVDLASWQNAVKVAAEWEIGDVSGAKPLLVGEPAALPYVACLSILVAALGTPYDIHTPGTILFIQDLPAKPYQIARILMPLKLPPTLKTMP